MIERQQHWHFGIGAAAAVRFCGCLASRATIPRGLTARDIRELGNHGRQESSSSLS
jgi:hypothetical protein